MPARHANRMAAPVSTASARFAQAALALLLLSLVASISRSPAQAATGCTGVMVPSTSDLKAVMSSHPAGTTYCLAAGTFKVTSTIVTEAGDRVVGAGRGATFIDGTRLATTAVGIFDLAENDYFADLSIFGAPTPAAESGIYCDPEANCGAAFHFGGNLTLRSIDCYDNAGACLNGGGSGHVIINGLHCWGNGSAYSMDPSFAYAACVKRAAAYEPGNDTIVRNSYIHDNAWVGIWCDFCKYGFFDIENSRIVHNGSNGVQWEMSGGWTSSDHALIKDNIIRHNNFRENPVGGGVGISTANDITVVSNNFGGNRLAGISIVFTVSRNPPQPESTGVLIKDNSMHGDSILGCGAIHLVNQLYHFRLQVAFALLIVAALLLAGFIVRRRRALMFGVGGVLGAVLVLVLIFVLFHHPVVTCLNNA
jgi:hypothetical protein